MMSPKKPAVKLVTGVLHPDSDWLDWTVKRLTPVWGPIEVQSETSLFSHTDYYSDIAPRLYRTFFSFRGLAFAGDLAGWKHFSCSVEEESGACRRVNIDPGYIDGARLVLASTKDHAHRIYIKEGVFAEVTLRFRFGEWESFDYTFPDFADGGYNDFLCRVRKQWIQDIRQMREADILD